MNKEEKIIMKEFDEGMDRIMRLFALGITNKGNDVVEHMGEELLNLINKAWRQGYKAGTLSKEGKK